MMAFGERLRALHPGDVADLAQLGMRSWHVPSGREGPTFPDLLPGGAGPTNRGGIIAGAGVHARY